MVLMSLENRPNLSSFLIRRPPRGRRVVRPNVLADAWFLAFWYSHFKDRKDCSGAVRRDKRAPLRVHSDPAYVAGLTKQAAQGRAAFLEDLMNEDRIAGTARNL